MSSSSPPVNGASGANEEFRILGVTRQGKTFRPADWAGRLCRVMAEYSPFLSATSDAGVTGVTVQKRLQQLAPMAYDVLVNFARDNELQTSGLDDAPLTNFSPPRAP